MRWNCVNMQRMSLFRNESSYGKTTAFLVRFLQLTTQQMAVLVACARAIIMAGITESFSLLCEVSNVNSLPIAISWHWGRLKHRNHWLLQPVISHRHFRSYGSWKYVHQSVLYDLWVSLGWNSPTLKKILTYLFMAYKRNEVYSFEIQWVIEKDESIN